MKWTGELSPSHDPFCGNLGDCLTSSGTVETDILSMGTARGRGTIVSADSLLFELVVRDMLGSIQPIR